MKIVVKYLIIQMINSKNLFFNGQSFCVTIVITTQNEKMIRPNIRKAMNNSIFTTSIDAINHFLSASNGYTKQIRNKSEKIIKRVFEHDYGLPTYRKLVFINSYPEPKYYCLFERKIFDDLIAKIFVHYFFLCKYTIENV